MSLDLYAEFEKYEDEYLRFDRIKSPRCSRPDLCAFMMLDALIPGGKNIIAASGHDEFFLEIDCEQLAKAATSEQIRDLVRCGIRLDDDCLAMFA